MASTTAANGSYLLQADPQNFPANPTGAPPPNNYQAPPSAQPDQQGQPPEVPKDEVGWYFVEQYYTTLNKSPERVHLFYNKKSTMVWGTEGESLPLAHGRADIHEKISAHAFKDCKVRVSNVDSQASAGGGIVIQVLGEMSNNSLPNRKFSQTFFLAEQPNGYYVLNDIFRYLKDDDDDDDVEEGEEYDYAEEVTPEAVADAIVEVAEETMEKVQELNVNETSTVELETAEGEKVKIEETVSVESVAAVEPETEEVQASVNGPVKPANGTEETEPEPETKPEDPVVPIEEEEKPVEESVPAPTAAEEKPAPSAPVKEAAPAAAPVRHVPAAPKTWANLVAAGATPARPTAPAVQPAAAIALPILVPVAAQTQAPPPSTPAAPATPATPTTSSGGSQWQTADSKRHRLSTVPGQTQAYVKNVTDAVTEKALKDVLTKYGTLKYFEIIRPKNCAFVEFETSAAFSAANSANPHSIAGANVLVEERRRSVNGAYGGGRGGVSNRGDGRPVNQGGRGYQTRGDGQRFEGGRGGRGGRGGGGYGTRGGVKTPAPGT